MGGRGRAHMVLQYEFSHIMKLLLMQLGAITIFLPCLVTGSLNI